MRTAELEKFKLVLFEYLDEALTETVLGERKIELSEMARANADQLALRIIQEVWGETLEYIRVEYPQTWWEHAKERFAPKWFKKRWPVRYSVAALEARALYPKLSLPDEPHNLKGHIREYDNREASLGFSKKYKPELEEGFSV